MAKKDAYELLEVDRNADERTIKRAFRAHAKKYHPDVNSDEGAEEKFREYAEAYEILSDADKKAKYDQYGWAAFENGGQRGGNPFGGGFGGFDFGDIFGDIFGGGRRRQRDPNAPTKGHDELLRYTIDFMDAAFGKTFDIKVNVDENCDHCNGSGAETPADVETCKTCGGTGVQQVQQRTVFGVMMNRISCRDCNGKGKTVKKKCHKCKGRGFKSEIKTIEIKIPAGIQSGQQLRVPKKGGKGTNGGPNGDLYIEINVKAHQFYKQKGRDVYLEVPLSFTSATIGATIDVPTIHGEVELKIPEGTQTDSVLRLRGKGISGGDQYIIIKLQTPVKLSKKIRKALVDALKEDNDGFFSKFAKKFKK